MVRILPPSQDMESGLVDTVQLIHRGVVFPALTSTTHCEKKRGNANLKTGPPICVKAKRKNEIKMPTIEISLVSPNRPFRGVSSTPKNRRR